MSRKRIEASVRCAVEVSALALHSGRFKLSKADAAHLCKSEGEKGYVSTYLYTYFCTYVSSLAF